jgi:hypothetical protein
VTPALKAARTAFNCPCVKEGRTSTWRLREFTSETGIFLPRRFVLSEHSSKQSIKFLIVKLLDRVWQISWQDMP